MTTDHYRAAAARDHDIELMFGDEPSSPQASIDPPGPFDRVAFERLCHWIVERDAIRLRRESGQPKPWTTDAVMRDVRWCNVRRWDDRVSRWLAANWYDTPLATLPQIAANAVLARTINWPDTLAELLAEGVNEEFNAATARRVLRARANRGSKLFTGAYKVSGIRGEDKTDTVVNQAERVFAEHAFMIAPSSMARTHALLQAIPAIGSFMAGQIVADLRHVHPGTWVDRNTWAPIGPGSQRGMAWLRGWDGTDDRVVERLAPPGRFLADLRLVRQHLEAEPAVRAVLDRIGAEMADLQNAMCESDKFSRLTSGTGQAKNRYPGAL